MSKLQTVLHTVVLVNLFLFSAQTLAGETLPPRQSQTAKELPDFSTLASTLDQDSIQRTLGSISFDAYEDAETAAFSVGATAEKASLSLSSIDSLAEQCTTDLSINTQHVSDQQETAVCSGFALDENLNPLQMLDSSDLLLNGSLGHCSTEHVTELDTDSRGFDLSGEFSFRDTGEASYQQLSHHLTERLHAQDVSLLGDDHDIYADVVASTSITDDDCSAPQAHF